MNDERYFVIRIIGGHIEVISVFFNTHTDAMIFYNGLGDKENVFIAKTIYG